MDLLAELSKNPFVLAPMAGITENSFRSFMKEMGCGILTTELISANGIEYKSKRTEKLTRFDPMQEPVGIQLFGEKPEAVAFAAKWVQDKGASFVDLNFGCPVKKVVNKGAGSAILKDLNALKTMLRTVKSAIEIPLTIKIRTGWTQDQRNAVEVAQIAYDEGVTWVAIHGRTRSQAYNGLADWDYIAEVKAKSKIPIIGNGDIHTPEQAVAQLKSSGCDAVMIGRGALKNPWIFHSALGLWKGYGGVVQKDFPKILERLRYYLIQNFDERVTGIQLKKFSSWFSSGYPGSSDFRREVFLLKNSEEVFPFAQDYFARIQKYLQRDTSHEAFLMGGHG